MNRIPLLILLLYLATIESAQAQPDLLWKSKFGGDHFDRANAVEQTSDGGFILTGTTASTGAGLFDLWLIRTDGDGTVLWERTFGGPLRERGAAVHQTSDGGYIVAGDTRSFGDGGGDAWLLRTDASGDSLWTKTYGGDEPEYIESMQITSDDGYILTGATESSGSGDEELLLIRTDADGATLWTRVYESEGGGMGESVQQTTDGGFIVAGSTNATLETCNIWILKTDVVGDTLWSKVFEHDTLAWPESIQQVSGGGYVLTGWIFPPGQDKTDLLTIRTDSEGGIIWRKTFGEPDGEEGGNSILQTEDGGFLAAGCARVKESTYRDIWLVKTDAAGELKWTLTIPGTYPEDGGLSLIRAHEGGYALCSPGWFYQRSREEDAYLIRLGPEKPPAISR